MVIAIVPPPIASNPSRDGGGYAFRLTHQSARHASHYVMLPGMKQRISTRKGKLATL